MLRLRGFGPCCSEAGSICVVPPPNRRLSEPFGRSGTLVHINVFEREAAPFAAALAEGMKGDDDFPCKPPKP